MAKRLTKIVLLISATLSMVACNSGGSQSPVTPAPATTETDTDISKLMILVKPNSNQLSQLQSATTAAQKKQLNKQLQQELMAALSVDQMRQIRAAVRDNIIDFAPVALGGRVLAFDHHLSPEQLQNAIESIKKEVSFVDDVENDNGVSPQEISRGEPSLDQWGLYAQFEADIFDWNTFSYIKQLGGGGGFYDNLTKQYIAGNGTGVTVAVVDTGYVPHPDFISALQPSDNLGHYGYQFVTDCYRAGLCPIETPVEQRYLVPHIDALETGKINPSQLHGAWHGTQAIGLIAGQAIEATGIIGAAPGAKIVPVRVLGKNSSGSAWSDVIDGILWSADLHPTIANPNPAKVISLSLGGAGVCSVAMQQIIDLVNAQGVVVVAAAGNDKGNADNFYPAACNGVISVAAADQSKNLFVTFSNAGSSVAVLAPSTSYSTNYYSPTAEYGQGCSGNQCYTKAVFSGTSGAAPFISALAADILSVYPNLTPVQIKQIIHDSADIMLAGKIKCSAVTGSCLASDVGTMNAAKAMELASIVARQ
ncbi:MAG: S8 family serine peptidase [Burkholderiales bacterium]|nr:S8 family serine peptidase [Burkholderiales bacterium]